MGELREARLCARLGGSQIPCALPGGSDVGGTLTRSDAVTFLARLVSRDEVGVLTSDDVARLNS